MSRAALVPEPESDTMVPMIMNRSVIFMTVAFQ